MHKRPDYAYFKTLSLYTANSNRQRKLSVEETVTINLQNTKINYKMAWQNIDY